MKYTDGSFIDPGNDGKVPLVAVAPAPSSCSVPVWLSFIEMNHVSGAMSSVIPDDVDERAYRERVDAPSEAPFVDADASASSSVMSSAGLGKVLYVERREVYLDAAEEWVGH